MLEGVKDLSFPWMWLLVVAAWCRGELASAIRCMVVARLVAAVAALSAQ